jgi:hypothetical protein
MNQHLPFNKAALIAGIGLLIMVFVAPVAEMYLYPKIIASFNPAETIANFQANKPQFRILLLFYLITFICDIIVAWALYLLLIHVNKSLSLFTAWLRLGYSIMALIAAFYLAKVYRIIDNPKYLEVLGTDALEAQVQFALADSRILWAFGFFLFAPHLIMLGYLLYKSKYIPKIFGILLVLNGLGYLIYESSPYLFPDANLNILMITFFGEIILMGWLLIKGRNVRVAGD